MATTTVNQSYRASIDLTFDYNENNKENRIDINTRMVQFISIINDYENNVLPVLYISLSADDSLYNKIHKYKDSAKFILTIYKYIYDTNEKSIKVRKKILKKSFSYIPSTSEANPRETLNEGVDGRESYRKITIGLVSKAMIDKLRKTYNGTLKNIDQETLVTTALEGLDSPIIEKLDYNKKYTNSSSIIIPPINTRYQLLQFIYTESPFYDTGFRFFMDFDKTYLLSNKGKKITASDGYPDEIMFNIVDLLDPDVVKEGMTINNTSYSMNLIPTAIQMLDNNALPMTTNKVVTVNEDGETSNLDLDFSNDDISPRTIYSRTIASDAIKNDTELNKIKIAISKYNIDPTVITPNKQITVKNFAANSSFDGTYILCNKNTILINTNGEFSIQVVAILKKVGKLSKAVLNPRTKEKEYKRVTNKAVKSTSRRKTTASKNAYTNRA